MTTKTIPTGTKPHNTVKIHPKFAQIGTWAPATYKKEGFTLLHFTFNGFGPIDGEETTIKDKNAIDLSFKVRNTDKAIALNSCVEIGRRVYSTKVLSDDASAVMKALLRDFPKFTFNIQQVVLINDKTKDIIILKSKGREQNKRLVVMSINGVPHHAVGYDAIAKAVGDLYYVSCYWKPGTHDPAFICDSE